MRQRVTSLGWRDVEVIDDDLGPSAATATKREGFQSMVSEVCRGKVGAIAAREVSHFVRNDSDWHELIEMCSLVETSSDKRIEKDPDLRVQRSIELVFEKCLEFGSARQALMWFLDHDLQFPSRRYGADGWETVWRRPYYQSATRILKEPMYAGAYGYGRTAEVSGIGVVFHAIS